MSKRTDREITQPQISETALLPNPEQGPIEREPDGIIALFDRDSDTFAEIAAVDIGAAAEGTAIFGIGTVEPKGERDRIAEQEIDLAAPQREPRLVRARIGANLDLGKQGLKISLMRGAGDHGDLLALEPLGKRIFDRGIALRHETGRRAVIGIGEIDPGA